MKAGRLNSKQEGRPTEASPMEGTHEERIHSSSGKVSGLMNSRRCRIMMALTLSVSYRSMVSLRYAGYSTHRCMSVTDGVRLNASRT